MSENNAQVTPRLPEKELLSFVADYFNRRHIYQIAAQTQGSPLWILESSVLRQNARRFSEAFNQLFPKTAFYFAMKSNNHPYVSSILLKSGFGLDVSSGKELKTAIDLNAEDIIFSGPGKTDDELSLAVHHRDRTVLLLDSFGELERLKRMVSGSDGIHPVRVGIRLTTNPNGLWRKFGIPLKQLPKFWEQIKNQDRIRFCGLQFHSSWNLTPDRQVEFLVLLGNTLKEMPDDFNRSVEFLDIGGGYWPETGEWLQFAGTQQGSRHIADGKEIGPNEKLSHYRIPGSPIEAFAKILYQTIERYIFPSVSCRICFEPGRWICHSAMHILFSVTDKKAHDLVITDAGTSAIGWERFETDYFPILNLTRSALEEKACDVLGALCTPHDVWGYAYFGEDIQVKDLLMIPCQGAYTYSLGQNFIKPVPTFHVV